MTDDPAIPKKPSPPLKTADGIEVVLNAQAEEGLARLASVLKRRAIMSSVLLIDDDDEDVYFLELAFREMDEKIAVHRVKNGAEAIDYIEGNGNYADRLKFPLPGLILLDLGLPRTGGLQVLAHIRGQRLLQEASIVALTASSSENDAEQALRLGVTAYIQKPKNAYNFAGIVRGLRSSGLI